VALKLKSLSELRKRISISLVEIPSEKVVLDLALSPSNSIVLITASEEGGSRASTSEIQILDMEGLEWTELQMIESKNVFYVKQKLEDMIERGPLNEFVPLKTKRLPSSDYGFIHANVKGLMSVSDGHNTIIISDD
jgi:hypothetical protein